MKKIKVLIVDDSALVRSILTKGLSAYSDIEVIGTAPDVYIARDKIVLKHPDVMTLDIEMPKMTGLDFLKRLMPQYPIPTIMVSSMTSPGATATMEAMEHGAVDFVLKPSNKTGVSTAEMIKELIEKIRIASTVDLSRYKQKDFKKTKETLKNPTYTGKILKDSTDKVIAIGASTGGTVALTKIIEVMPPDTPGTIIVQHMPAGFTRMFADRLNQLSKMEVKEAEDKDRIIQGRVLIAPGDKHMRVYRSGGFYYVKCEAGEKVSGHCPSVDILFDSVAEQVGSNAVGVELTGMGKDGAFGMLKMRKNGARTIAQDEKSSVVFGMPKEAFLCGGAEVLVPLKDIPKKIISLINNL